MKLSGIIILPELELLAVHVLVEFDDFLMIYSVPCSIWMQMRSIMASCLFMLGW